LGSGNGPRWSWEAARSAFDWGLVWRQRNGGVGCLETRDSGEQEGWMGAGAGAGSGRVSATPPREIPPRGVSGLLLGAEFGRLKRRLPAQLRCRGGAAHQSYCHRRHTARHSPSHRKTHQRLHPARVEFARILPAQRHLALRHPLLGSLLRRCQMAVSHDRSRPLHRCCLHRQCLPSLLILRRPSRVGCGWRRPVPVACCHRQLWAAPIRAAARRDGWAMLLDNHRRQTLLTAFHPSGTILKALAYLRGHW